jgi:DNA repair protein RadC
MIKEKDLKRGHRERLRQRFEKSGFEGFHDYEIVELLLTYAIPRIDTKPVAKTLLGKFKTIQKVLDAPSEQLKEVDGLGRNATLFLRILRETIAEYFKEMAIARKEFRNIDELVGYLRDVIGGRQNEIVYVLYLNSKNELLDSDDLGEGTVSEAVAFPRKIVQGALKRNATSIILAHNHPGGIPEPSENDNAITKQIKNALQTVNISLQEHIIIAEEEFYSYRRSGYFDS